MTNNRDIERLLADWLDDGPPMAADRVLDQLAERIAHQGQRPTWLLNTRETQVITPLRMMAAAAILAVAVGGIVWGSQLLGRSVGDTRTPPAGPSSSLAACQMDMPRTPVAWSGQVRSDAASLPVLCQRGDGLNGLSWPDPHDAEVGGIDITDLFLPNDSGGRRWTIGLAERPPEGADSNEAVIEYGLVFDTSGDRIADYVIGINNDVPKGTDGNLRVWVTSLATGLVEEQVGGPYGYPIDFSHPTEQTGRNNPAHMSFFFLQAPVWGGALDNAPDGSIRYYAWASMTQNGEVVAWDYAPDFGWLTEPPESVR